MEVKPGPEIVPAIKDVFAAQEKATPRNTLFISFNEKTCKALKAAMPKYKVYWLVSPKKGTAFATAGRTPSARHGRMMASATAHVMKARCFIAA